MLSPDDFEERAVALALHLEQQINGLPADVVVASCCWILADMVLQVEHVHQTPNAEAVDLILRKLWCCVENLKQTADAKVH